MKLLLATVITLTASSAFAFGGGASNPGQLNGCGPKVTANLSESGGGYGGSSTSLTLGLEWKIGGKSACERNNAYVNDQRMRASRSDEAETQQTETRTFSQKIELCSQFTKEIAPRSIVNFCGDLLGVPPALASVGYKNSIHRPRLVEIPLMRIPRSESMYDPAVDVRYFLSFRI